jgi:lipid-A-disaccharide synthase
MAGFDDGPGEGGRGLRRTAKAPLIFLIAGEPSGDLLGARLMAALKAESDGRVRFAGVGGEHMAAQGLESLVPISEFAVMGLIEVLPHLWRIYRHIRYIAATARRLRPDVVVTIDSPNFTLEVAKRLKGELRPLIHFVAPQVWAWKARRARRIAAFLDHLLVLLPFEPPYFARHGLETTFVGHPAVEARYDSEDRTQARRSLGIPLQTPLLLVLPGSRRGEVRRLAPVFGETVERLGKSFPDLEVVVPTVAQIADLVEAETRAWPRRVRVISDPEAKRRLFAAADAALAASGTVVVELAVARVPTVVAYRVSGFSAYLARRLLKVRFASMINILLGHEVQPEYLQERCTAPQLATALVDLLGDEAARARQRDAVTAAVAKLTPEGETPSTHAARVILESIAADQAPSAAPFRGSEVQEVKARR